MAIEPGHGPPPISDGTPSPSNLEEFETLILRFYQPANLALVSSIEKHLQWHQRSDQGWEMAFALLQSRHVNVRFFGALTLAVKLNTSGKDLNEEQAQIFRQKLQALYVECSTEAPLVAQKLVSDLAIFYMQPSASSDKCVATMAALLLTGSPNGNEGAVHDIPLSTSLSRLDSGKLFALLKFVNALAEEGSKRLADAGSHKKQAAIYQDRVESNLRDAVEVMHSCLDPSKLSDNRTRTQGVNCLASWALFCQKAAAVDHECLSQLRTLIRPALRFAAEDVDCTSVDLQPSLDVLSELLSAYPAFFKTEHLQDVSELLRSPIGQQYMSKLKEADDDAMPFARLLCAYVDADLTRIVEAPNDPPMQRIIGKSIVLIVIGQN